MSETFTGATSNPETTSTGSDNRPALPDFKIASQIVKAAIDNRQMPSQKLEQHIDDAFKQRLDGDRRLRHSACTSATINLGHSGDASKLNKGGLLDYHGRQSLQQLATLIYLGQSMGMDDAKLNQSANRGMTLLGQHPREYKKLLIGLMVEVANRWESVQGHPATSGRIGLSDIDRRVGECHATMIKTIVDSIKDASQGALACRDFQEKNGEPLDHDATYAGARNLFELNAAYTGDPDRFVRQSSQRVAYMTSIVDMLKVNGESNRTPATSDASDNTSVDGAPLPDTQGDGASSTPAQPPRSVFSDDDSGVDSDVVSDPDDDTISQPTPAGPPATDQNSEPPVPAPTPSSNEHIAEALPPTSLKQPVSVDDPEETSIRSAPLESTQQALAFSRFSWTNQELNSLRFINPVPAIDQYVMGKLKYAFQYDSVRPSLDAIADKIPSGGKSATAINDLQSATAINDFHRDLLDRLTDQNGTVQEMKVRFDARHLLTQFYSAVLRTTIPGKSRFADAMQQFVAASRAIDQAK